MQRGDGKCDQRPMIFIASVKMVFDMVIYFILFYLTSNYRLILLLLIQMCPDSIWQKTDECKEIKAKFEAKNECHNS